MGQSHSADAAHAATPEQLSTYLAQRLAEKCFTPLELTHFKDNFVNLADVQDGLQYWKEDTLCRYLQIPDAVGANHVLGQMMSYLGAWPISSLAPAIMTRESLCKIVVLLTKRYQKVLRGGTKARSKILFRSLAVYDRRASQAGHPEIRSAVDVENKLKDAQLESPKHAAGFQVDEPGLDEEEDEDDDAVALAALESLDAIEVFSLEKTLPRPESDKISHTQIPVDNFRSLILLLLLVAPLHEQESLAGLAKRSVDENLQRVHQVGDSILWAFSPEKMPGISYANYKRIINNSLPYMFDGFNPLFEHFLFSKHLNLSKRRRTSSATSIGKADTATPAIAGARHELDPDSEPEPEPILLKSGDVLDETLLCQISFFVPSVTLFRRLRLLYTGSSDGFSINSYEQKVLNWRAPTIFLVQGTRAVENSNTSSHTNFPARRHGTGSSGNSKTNRVVFGALVNVPWKHTHKEPFGDDSSVLFQLEPVHTVFRASSLNHDYATLTKQGISFGSPVPRDKPISGLPDSSTTPLGPVSLNLDGNLESGVFMHDGAGGGAYGADRWRTGAGGGPDWEERFDVEHVEVWGCGGDEVAKEQRERWKWEEREAMARRGINRAEDKDQAYALLEMAGLVGQGRSGGSMA